MVVSLYIQASDKRILAMWILNNATISNGYTTKIFLDENGDIWIRNVNPSDAAEYILTSRIQTNIFRYNMTLNVQVAPTINCKPTIIRMDDVLVASLNPTECGKPLVSVDWLNYRGIKNEGNEFNVPKTDKYGIYYACISGPAIRCVQTSKLSEYCSAYSILDSSDSTDVSSKPGRENSEPIYIVVMLVAILLVLGLVICGLLLFLRTYRNGALCENRRKRSNYTAVSTNTELL
ncbi:hypothetical protein ACJMK2_027051, partial [Sinanodonta woodiana]